MRAGVCECVCMYVRDTEKDGLKEIEVETTTQCDIVMSANSKNKLENPSVFSSSFSFLIYTIANNE